MRLVLVPGMNGTGDLFDPLLEALPNTLTTQVLTLPDIGSQDPIQLAKRLIERLPTSEDYVLLGESFGGRIAYELSANRPATQKGLILAASFLERPLPRAILTTAKSLAQSGLLRHSTKAPFARHLIAGHDVTEQTWLEIKHAIENTPTELFSKRLRALSQLPKPKELIELPCLYLRPSRDLLIRVSSTRKTRQYLPNLKFIDIEGPHFLLQANPIKCANEILKFIHLIEGDKA